MSKFPALDPDAIVVTRDALHAYARILGDWLKDLVAMDDPAAYLQELWSTLLAAGQTHLATNE